MRSAVLLLLLGAQVARAEGVSDGIKEVDSNPKLAILSLAAQGVPEEYAAALTESIATEITRTGVFETISPRQIASILAYEKRKDTLGACVNDDCFLQVARAVKAGFLIGGSVGKVGEQLVLNLILIGAQSGETLSRAKRETSGATELSAEAYRTAFVLLEPLLSKRRGYLKVNANVDGARIFINGDQRAEPAGQAISLASGPHVVEVKKDGFYPAAADLLIRPGQVLEQRVALIPSKETIEAYETKATLLRVGAYTTGALAVGAAVLSAVFYAQASENKTIVDRFTESRSIDQTAEARARALRASDDFSLDQGLYLGALGGAVLLGGASLFCFLAGDDPDRYEQFHEVAESR